MASLTSSPAALPAATTTTASPAASVSPHAGGTSKRPLLAGDDAPWRVAATGAAAVGLRPVPRIHHAPVLRVATQDDFAAYALAVMKVCLPRLA
jgi:hypothetical protein